MSSTELHLKTQLAELQRQYDTLTKRIAAVVTDIGRELDSERKLVLETRRADLVAERDQIAADMAQIEQQLATSGSATAQDAATIPAAQTAPIAPASPEDHSSLSNLDGDRDSSSSSSPVAPPPQPSARRRAGCPTFIWAIIGALLVAVVGTLFFNQTRCLIEYRLTEAVVGLIVFLAAGAGAVFSSLAPPDIRRALQTFYGGLTLALLGLVLLAILKPALSTEYCQSVGSPRAEPTSLPRIVSTPSNPIPASEVVPVAQITDSTTITTTPALPGILIPTPGAGTTAVGLNQTILVYVPRGKFRMGSSATDPDAYDSETPQHELEIEGFWISRTEVTNAQYNRCVLAGACTPPDNQTYSQPEYADRPITSLDWHQANAYAHWVGGRLPTEAEWEKACRGTDARVYPWGNDTPSDELLNYNFLIGSTRDVGSYPQGASPYGLLDMVGNVWEWTSSLWGPAESNSIFLYPYSASDGREDQTAPDAVLRVTRGGAFISYARVTRCATRGVGNPLGRHGDTGFRIVASPWVP